MTKLHQSSAPLECSTLLLIRDVMAVKYSSEMCSKNSCVAYAFQVRCSITATSAQEHPNV